MKSSDVKRKPGDEDRISSGRSSKAQRTEVWGNQMDSLNKQIEKLIEKENKLNDQLADNNKLLLKGLIDKGEYDKEKASLKAQIAETQKEIQAKEAELKEMTKKFEESAQAMETEESGGAKLTEIPAGGDYAKALVEAGKREAGDAKISKFLPMVLLTVCTLFIPGFTEIAEEEEKLTKDKGIEGILIFGRKCFVQVVKEFRRLRKEYIDGAIGRFCILAGQSGIGKSLAFSQMYMREAFIQGEKVAFYSVREATIYLFRMEGGKYTCQQAEVNDQGFWKTKAWKTFDDRSAHLIIDPAPRQGHKYFKTHLVKAFVVYLTSPNNELSNFEKEIRDLRRTLLFVPTLAIEESKVIAIELKENPSVFLERMKRTGGQLREFIREDKYELFKGYQDNAWAGIAAKEHIHFGDLKVSSRIFSVQPSPTDETLLYSEKYVIVPQSEWVKSKIFQVYAEKHFKNFTGLDGEKWFFAKIYKGCKLLARRLPKNLADAEKKKKNDDWENKIHEFPAHSTLKTFSDGVENQRDRCQEYIKKTAEDQKAELVVCPTNYPAIDGATNCRTLYQVTISSKKSVGKAYVDELISFGASKAEKARVFFLVPQSIAESFSISFSTGFKEEALKLAEFWVVGINLIQMIEEAQKKKSKITAS
uniref:Uncharacterized protein n=1 Tax=Lotharella oceanica TaxID=641309 RepID=A0A7S2U5S8_9EUKA|mmetsp:Transcript_9344/g.18173  ORF Transcript_9344/g.18173 Transcript_9344/m.18173 type:complete len:646 (+) Transcript_9344:105-2042(+)